MLLIIIVFNSSLKMAVGNIKSVFQTENAILNTTITFFVMELYLTFTDTCIQIGFLFLPFSCRCDISTHRNMHSLKHRYPQSVVFESSYTLIFFGYKKPVAASFAGLTLCCVSFSFWVRYNTKVSLLEC